MKSLFSLNSAIYLLLCLFTMQYAAWYADNPDSFQYLSIARHYIHGDFSAAINGYWSPLISWLLVPFLATGLNGILSFKILQILIGLFTVIEWKRFIESIIPQSRMQKLFSVFIIPFTISAGIFNLTPDLLFTTLILFLINQLNTSFGDRDRILGLERRELVLLGATGGLLFLSKAFGLPLFVFLMAVVFMYRRRFFTPKKLLTVITVFSLISGIWILLLSQKYNHFTISEAARFNMTHEVAPLSGQIINLPVINSGLIDPPYPTSLSAWETPGSVIPLTTVKPYEEFSFYLKVIRRNLESIYFTDFRRQIGWVFLAAVILFFLFRKNKNEQIPFVVLLSVLTIVSVYLGYTLILVHERYTWICMILMVPASLYFLSRVDTKIIPKQLFLAITLVLFFLAIKRPVKQILFTSDSKMNLSMLWKGARTPRLTMGIFYETDERLNLAANKVQSMVKAGATFASVRQKDADRERYASSLFIVDRCEGKYYGQVDSINDPSLSEKSIDYLIEYGSFPDSISNGVVYEDAYFVKVRRLKRYDLESYFLLVLLKPGTDLFSIFLKG